MGWHSGCRELGCDAVTALHSPFAVEGGQGVVSHGLCALAAGSLGELRGPICHTVGTVPVWQSGSSPAAARAGPCWHSRIRAGLSGSCLLSSVTPWVGRCPRCPHAGCRWVQSSLCHSGGREGTHSWAGGGFGLPVDLGLGEPPRLGGTGHPGG